MTHHACPWFLLIAISTTDQLFCLAEIIMKISLSNDFFLPLL